MKRTSRSLTAALLGIAALLAGCIKPNTFDPYANPGRGELDRRQKIVNGRPDLETVQQQLANLDATIRAMIAKYSPQTRFSTGVTVSHLNRPGMSGDSSSWKGWGHVRWFIEEVPAGAA